MMRNTINCILCPMRNLEKQLLPKFVKNISISMGMSTATCSAATI